MHVLFVQARKLVQAAEAEDEISGLPLPLLARAAGHWKARTDHRHKDPAPAVVASDKPLSPLEELMGQGKLNGMDKPSSGVILTCHQWSGRYNDETLSLEAMASHVLLCCEVGDKCRTSMMFLRPLSGKSFFV